MKKSIINHSVSALTLAGLVFSIAACDQNSDRRSVNGASLKVKCEKGFNVNNEQQALMTKNLNNKDVVVRTLVLRDDVSNGGKDLSNGDLLGQKSVTDMQKSKELVTLATDCKNLTAKYAGIGASEGLQGRIISVSKDSVGMINGRKGSKFYQTITIERLKPALTAEDMVKIAEKSDRKGAARKQHAAKNAPVKAAKGEATGEGFKIRITETGEVNRVFEAVQIFEKKTTGQNIVVSKDSIMDIAIVLTEKDFPLELKEAMTAAPKDSSEIVVNTLDLANALDMVTTKVMLAKSTAANTTAASAAETAKITTQPANTNSLTNNPTVTVPDVVPAAIPANSENDLGPVYQKDVKTQKTEDDITKMWDPISEWEN